MADSMTTPPAAGSRVVPQSIVEPLNNLIHAAENYGWSSDQGSDSHAKRDEERLKAAEARLVAAIADAIEAARQRGYKSGFGEDRDYG